MFPNGHSQDQIRLYIQEKVKAAAAAKNSTAKTEELIAAAAQNSTTKTVESKTPQSSAGKSQDQIRLEFQQKVKAAAAAANNSTAQAQDAKKSEAA